MIKREGKKFKINILVPYHKEINETFFYTDAFSPQQIIEINLYVLERNSNNPPKNLKKWGKMAWYRRATVKLCPGDN